MQQKGQRDFAHAGLTMFAETGTTGSHECLYFQQTSVQPHREIDRSVWDQRRKEEQLTFPQEKKIFRTHNEF